MRVVQGTFNGTGATVYICVGFVPDFVTLWNCEGTQVIKVEWNAGMMRSAEIMAGIQYTGADVAAAALTVGTGVAPYRGGDMLTTTMAGTTTYAEGVYLTWDLVDYRYYSGNSVAGVGDAVAVNIDTWTLQNSTNKTGKWNEDINGTYIGEGSPICIDGKWYVVAAVAAAAGEGDNEVTLSEAAKSGEVQFIGGMYSLKPMVAEKVTPAGFSITNTTLNVDDQIIVFEAGTYSL